MLEWQEAWNKKINGKTAKLVWSGCYYRFETIDDILSAGSDGDFDENTKCVLTSCTKVYAGMAVMRTMVLKPRDWYPEKYMHEFEGWEDWRNFKVLDNEDTDGKPGWSGRRADVNVHHLLTHTSGWPFGLQGSRDRIRHIPLYFEPGTEFGYSIGHRLLGWMLLDYWKKQPEGQNFENLNDVFKFLVYEPFGISESTHFLQERFRHPHSIMGEFFNMAYFDRKGETDDDDPADLAMESTGADMMKLAMVALRRGQLPDGTEYIPMYQWNEWAATNKLPGGKLSKALAHWRMEDNKRQFLFRTAITRTVNAGPFGWSYFGATYHNYDGEGDAGPVIAVGWKGFSSCGFRADYDQQVAFCAMQEIVPDPGCRNFGECIHQGKVSMTDKESGERTEFSLITVGSNLAQMDPEEMKMFKSGPTRCCGIHEVMMHKDGCCPNLTGCTPMTGCLQGIIRCAFQCLLPIGVKTLHFHRYEQDS